MFGKSTAFHRLTRFKSKGQTFLIFIKIKRFFYHFFSNIITLNKLSILTIASSVEQVYTFYVHISIRIPILIVIENNYNLLEMLQQGIPTAVSNKHTEIDTFIIKLSSQFQSITYISILNYNTITYISLYGTELQ